MQSSVIRSTVFSVFASVLVSSAASAAAIPEDHRGSGRYHEPVKETIEQAGHVECPPGTRYRSSSADPCQPTATKPVLLAQYSENPTIPGDGTPQRTQGSGTR